MRVTALGHAGLRVEARGGTLLLDPWFSPEGAFQASWFPFPDNSHLLHQPNLWRPDAVVVSHEHLDHVDPWFLGRLDPDVPVVIPRYPSPVLRRKILSAGERTIVEVEPWEVVDIAAGLRLFFVSEPAMNHDSAIVVQADGYALLNLNDARLFPVQLREIRGRIDGPIDVLTLQGAGASWYPICYDYPPERRRELSQQKRQAKFGYCASVIRAVDPVIAVPFAGPPAFLDPALAHHNAELDGGIFPDQQQVIDWLATRRRTNTALLLPGDAWDAARAAKDADPMWHGFSFAEAGAYIADYATRRRPEVEAVLARHPAPDRSLWPEFAAYFDGLLGMSDYFCDRIGMRVGFEIAGPGGGDWAVDFRPGRRRVDPRADDCAYVYSFDGRWLPPLLAGEVPWEDFMLSLRFRARRDPDRYNDHLLGLLKFAEPTALAAVEEFETGMATDDRIELHHEGRTYLVQRHCPHAGNDLLETGEVLPGGVLRCLAHHYDFDLSTGECISGICAPLDVKEIDERGPGLAAARHRTSRG